MKTDSPVLPFDPFAARAVGDPWKSPEPDIASINAKPFQRVLEVVAKPCFRVKRAKSRAN
jgi:hypothetical protein